MANDYVLRSFNNIKRVTFGIIRDNVEAEQLLADKTTHYQQW